MTEHHTTAGPAGTTSGAATRSRLPGVAGLVLVILLDAGAAYQLVPSADSSSAGGAGHDAGHGAGSAGDQEVQVLGGDAAAGVPTVQRVVHDDTAVTVAVGPAVPGENLVRLDLAEATAGHGEGHGSGHDSGHDSGSDDDEVLVGSATTSPVAAREVPGTDGLWARVDLDAGSDDVVVTHHGVEHRFTVTTGEEGGDVSAAWSGTDAPECLSAAVGVMAAGERPDAGACPGDALDADHAAVLDETVATLGSRGLERLAVHADSSPRSREALTVVRRAADAAGIEVVGADAPATGRTALLDVAGWEPAAAALADISRLPVEQQPIRSDGTWLAPWLMSRGVVDSTSGAVLPLDFDIRSAEPSRYADVLRTLLPGQAPTASGYAAYSEASGAEPEPVQLYAASRASVQMSEPGLDGSDTHSHATQISWFPGGTITPVGTLAAATGVPTARTASSASAD